MPSKNSENPGYIGFNEIANEALQTGVHCCDIAMHIDGIKNNPLINSALEFLEQSLPRKRPFFNYIPDEGNAIINAQTTLNQFLQQKRRHLCRFAITKIRDPNESQTFCKLLGPEIKTALLEGGGRDFSASRLSSKELSVKCNHALVQFSLKNEKLLDEFCQKPEVCIDYIKHYYLVGNEQNDDPISAKMFIVPAIDSTGMLNIAAIQLKRKIIVVSARNGQPFTTEDYSNGTQAPIYIGYDGHLHFVELRPYTIAQLEKMSDSLTDSNLEKAIYESIRAIAIAQQTLEIQPQQLKAAQQRLIDLKVKYAEILTAEKSFARHEEKFMQLLINDAEPQNVFELYWELLEIQKLWFNTVTLSEVDETRSEQIQSQKQVLQQFINTKIPNIDEAINKNLVNIVYVASESRAALAVKTRETLGMAQQLKDFFVANAYQNPRAQQQVDNETASWFKRLRALVNLWLTSLRHHFRVLVSTISTFMAPQPPVQHFVVSVQSDESEPPAQNIPMLELPKTPELPKTKTFTPLADAEKKPKAESPKPKPPAKVHQHFSIM